MHEAAPSSTTSAVAPRCEQCGAPQPDGASCRECFDALLAYENERPTVFFSVHHLTVTCYSLQHPHGYGHDVLAAWHALLADALDGRTTIAALRKRMGAQFAGAKRVRDASAMLPPDWPRVWSMTVADVLDAREALPSEEEYVARAERWAAAVRHALDPVISHLQTD